MTVDQIINIVLIVLFALIIVGFFIAGLIGWKRGVFNATFRLLFMGALVIISFLCCGVFGNWIGNIDFQGMLKTFGVTQNTVVLTNSLTGQTFTFAITSVYNTFASFVYGACKVMNVSVSTDLITYATAVASAFMNLIAFFICGILVVSIGNLLAVILWNALFKRFIPRRVLKRRRIKWLSMIEGVVKYVLVGSMLLLPVTSILGTVSRAYKNGANGDSDSALATNIGSFISVYDDSVFAKVFFNWTTNSSGVSIDQAIMDWVLSTSYQDAQTSIYDLLNSVGTISGALISNGLIDESGNFVLDPALFANTDFVLLLLEAISTSDLLVYAVPIALSIVLNLDVVSSYIDASLIDAFDYNWGQEIDNIQALVNDVIDSGLIDLFVNYDVDGNATGWKDMSTVSVEEILTKLVDEESYPYFKRALTSIDNSDLLSTVIPAVLYSLSKSDTVKGLGDYLPKSWDEFKDIKWGHELSILYHSLYEINRADSNLLTAVLSLMDTSGSTTTSPTQHPVEIATRNSFNSNTGSSKAMSQEEIMKLILGNASRLSQIFVGSLDDNGSPMNVDEYGYTKVYDDSGNRINGREYCLFDSSLMSYAFRPLINTLLSLITESGTVSIDEAAVSAAVDDLSTGNFHFKYKKEVGAILNVLGDISKSDALMTYITNPSSSTLIEFDSSGNIKSVDEEGMNVLESVLKKLDNSKIMNEVLSSLIKGVFDNDSLKSSLLSFGIDATLFDWDVDNIGAELAKLISIVKPVSLIQSKLSSGSPEDALTVINDNKEDFIKLFDTFYSSNIINPKNSSGVMITDNFTGFISTLLGNVMPSGFDMSSFNFDSITKWDTSTMLDGDFFRDALGNIIIDGENGALIDFIAKVAQNDIYSVLTSTLTQETIGQLETTYHISEIFAKIGNSKILSTCFPTILDDMLETYGLLESGSEVSFGNITNWEEEGIVFGKICTTLGKFNSDLASINFLKCSTELIQELFDNLIDSGIFVAHDASGNETFLFNDFIYGKLKQSLSSGTSDYFRDPYENISDPATYLCAKADFASANAKSDWKDLDARALGKTDLILSICNVIKVIQDANTELGIDYTATSVDPLAVLSNSSLPSTTLKKVVLATNDVSLFRIVIYNAIDSILDSLSSSTFSLENANTRSLLNMTKVERAAELTSICDIYGSFIDLDLVPSGGVIDVDLATLKTKLPQLRSLLDNLYSSITFNSFYAIDNNSLREGSKLTVFENAISLFVSSQSMETDVLLPGETLAGHIISINNSNADSTIAFVDDEWLDKYDASGILISNGELTNVFNVLKTSTEILDSSSSLNFTFDYFMNLLLVEGSGTTLSGQVRLSNFFHAINDSLMFYRVMPTKLDAIFSDPSSSSTFASILPDMNFASANAFYNGTAAYDNSEIDVLMDILHGFASIKQNYDNHTYSTLMDIDSTVLLEVLDNLNTSKIFHRSGPAKNSDGTYKGNQYSVFQQVMVSIIGLDDMEALNFNANSPKDMANIASGLYSNYDEKVSYLVTSVFPYAGTPNFDAQQDEASKLMDIFDIAKTLPAKGTGTTSNISLVDFDAIDSTLVSNLLNAINDSNLLYDGVPNTIYVMSSTDGIDLAGVSLSSSNPYYHYTSSGVLNYEARYDNAEIAKISAIVDDIHSLNAKGATFYSDLSNLTPAETTILGTTLKHVQVSYVFNLAGSSNSDPTVFEQVIIKVYSDSGLDDLAYNALEDSAYASSSAKIKYLVTNYTDTSIITTSLNDNDWDKEIDAVIAMIDQIYVSTNNGSVNFGSLDMTNFNPSDINLMLNSINAVDTLHDIVPNVLSDAFTSLGLDDYTTLNSVDYAHYRVGQFNYRDVDLDLLDELFSMFYDSTTQSYVMIGSGTSGLTDFVNNGNSTQGLIHLLSASNIYKENVIDGAFNYKARDLFFYSLLDNAGLTDYITGAARGNKCETIKSLFLKTTFDYRGEGIAFDNIAKNIGNLASGASLGDIAYLTANASNISKCISSTYDVVISPTETYARAYLASEVVAGLSEDVLQQQYDTLDSHGTVYQEVSFHDNDYANLNKWEALGVESGIKAANESSKSIASIDKQLIKDSFREMSGDLASDQVSESPAYGNSKIASIFYLSSVVDNINSTMPYFFVVYPQYSNPYLTGFVFENVGNTLYNYLP